MMASLSRPPDHAAAQFSASNTVANHAALDSSTGAAAAAEIARTATKRVRPDPPSGRVAIAKAGAALAGLIRDDPMVVRARGLGVASELAAKITADRVRCIVAAAGGHMACCDITIAPAPSSIVGVELEIGPDTGARRARVRVAGGAAQFGSPQLEDKDEVMLINNAAVQLLPVPELRAAASRFGAQQSSVTVLRLSNTIPASALCPYRAVSVPRDVGGSLGIRVVTDNNRSWVESVRSGSGADVAGLAAGDVVKQIAGRSTINMAHSAVMEAVRTAPSPVELVVARNGSPVNLVSSSGLSTTKVPVVVDSPVAPHRPRAYTEPAFTSPSSMALDGSDITEGADRRATVYGGVAEVPRSVSMRARLRRGIDIPISFALSEMGQDEAARMLFGWPDGSYLFRESRGATVLSMTCRGVLTHHKLNLSAASSFRELDRSLRKFVRQYTARQAPFLPCLLTSYVTEGAEVPGPAQPRKKKNKTKKKNKKALKAGLIVHDGSSSAPSTPEIQTKWESRTGVKSEPNSPETATKASISRGAFLRGTRPTAFTSFGSFAQAASLEPESTIPTNSACIVAGDDGSADLYRVQERRATDRDGPDEGASAATPVVRNPSNKSVVRLLDATPRESQVDEDGLPMMSPQSADLVRITPVTNGDSDGDLNAFIDKYNAKLSVKETPRQDSLPAPATSPTSPTSANSAAVLISPVLPLKKNDSSNIAMANFATPDASEPGKMIDVDALVLPSRPVTARGERRPQCEVIDIDEVVSSNRPAVVAALRPQSEVLDADDLMASDQPAAALAEPCPEPDGAPAIGSVMAHETSADPDIIAATPRRRKLVRGGNVKATPVLPEYQLALKALNSLDTFLNRYEELQSEILNFDGPTQSESESTKSSGGLLKILHPKRKGGADFSVPDGFESDGRRSTSGEPFGIARPRTELASQLNDMELLY